MLSPPISTGMALPTSFSVRVRMLSKVKVNNFRTSSIVDKHVCRGCVTVAADGISSDVLAQIIKGPQRTGGLGSSTFAQRQGNSTMIQFSFGFEESLAGAATTPMNLPSERVRNQ
jgi:hypothetical protein